MALEPTGERMIPEDYRNSPSDFLIYLFHVATYRFAEPYIFGKRILDYGCGSGYGSEMIANSAAQVCAVDVDEEAIAYARTVHPERNLSFSRISADAPLPFADASFDVVTSFQVFEHVTNTDRYLLEARRVLKPGGVLLLATPDRKTRLFPFQRPWNRWHLREYGPQEMAKLIDRHFQVLETLGMTAKPSVLDIELKRCTKLKWLSLPFTLPINPDSWRVAALNLIHRLRERPSATCAAADTAYSFSIEDITIAKDAAPSVNTIIIARRS